MVDSQTRGWTSHWKIQALAASVYFKDSTDERTFSIFHNQKNSTAYDTN